jgi:periplasmic divalent cation tolerance protein
MKSTDAYRLVLVTCSTPMQAKLIARTLVEKRLAACVNILRSPVESHYRWKGKVDKAKELLLIIKTAAHKLTLLEREVRKLHNYEVPEVLVVPVVAGSEEYLNWLGESVT